jgi:hypothetical protein
MSERPSPRRSGGTPTGAVGLALALLYCVGVAVSPARPYPVLLAGALGLAGLVLSALGIAKGPGRAAGIFGVLAFLLGCLMAFPAILDMVTHARGH